MIKCPIKNCKERLTEKYGETVFFGKVTGDVYRCPKHKKETSHIVVREGMEKYFTGILG